MSDYDDLKSDKEKRREKYSKTLRAALDARPRELRPSNFLRYTDWVRSPDPNASGPVARQTVQHKCQILNFPTKK